YKPDAPLQWNAFELIFAGVPYGAPHYSRFFQQRLEESGGVVADIIGEVIEGYDKFDVWQFQSTYIQFFDRVLGADQLAMAAEVGVNYIPGLPDTDKARYGRPGAYGIGNTIDATGAGENACAGEVSGAAALANLNQNYCTDEGYVTEWSGGVRLRAGLTYNNAFAGLNVTPNINLAYDVGYGPEP